MIIPDYLIIDEIKRRKEKQWQPEMLRLPLYVPTPDADEASRKRQSPVCDEKDPKPGVIIIDMNTYERLL
ncbi:MAG: hypothetical protein FWC40_08715 [Proteobacteria bacterium]|nr:hypothetical protein [Pseudomonadota bacterium]